MATRSPPTVRRGIDAVLDVLRSEGVARVFGNPGSTELPFMEALARADDIEYVLALQEASAVAMAEGHALASRRPAFLNLHTAAGLGNAIGALTNARKNGSPLVVTAGQQDRRHTFADPLLSGDLTGLAFAVSKWTREVATSVELGTVLRRAFHDASTPPTGPVFVSIPMDVLDEPGDAPVPAPSRRDGRSVAGSLDELARRLSSVAPERLAVVAGDEVAASDALDPLVEVAELLGARVLGSPMHAQTVFPTVHPLWAGALPPAAAAIRDELDGVELVLLIGGQAFMTFPYTPGPTLPPGAELLHLSPDGGQLGRTHPTTLGACGDPRATLEALVPRLRDRIDHARTSRARGDARRARAAADERLAAEVRGLAGPAPMHPLAAVGAALDAAPADVTLVDEAVTTDRFVRRLHRTDRGGRFYYCRAGGLGWGIPAAVGVCLAQGRTPTLCIVGDGAALYAPQALWTAARERLPIVFVVVDNRQYLILKNFSRGRGADADAVPGMDLVDPAVDFVALARSFGVQATSAGSDDELRDAVRAAFAADVPFLIHAPIRALEAEGLG